MKYSQINQDIFVLNVLNHKLGGFFVDLGCQKPEIINNTLLLEKWGWSGISMDIKNYSEEWKIRNTPFLNMDALNTDYQQIFSSFNLPELIDYLSIDLEGAGQRFLALKKVLDSGYQFKVITIEHDIYRGSHYIEQEQNPQRKLLIENGYFLVASNVCLTTNAPMEDWWVNPRFVKEKYYYRFLSEGKLSSKILSHAGIDKEKYYQ